MDTFHVIKRNGSIEQICFEKISARLLWLSKHPSELRINPVRIAQNVFSDVQSGIHTRELDEYAADVASNMTEMHPDFAVMATRIAVNNHHKNTLDCFSSTIEACYTNTDQGVHTPRITKQLYKFVGLHKNTINTMIDYDRDYRFTYMGFKTLLGSYLIKRTGSAEVERVRPQDLVLERPQDMWMRVSCAIHMNRDQLNDTSVLARVRESYDAMSLGHMTHATPTLTNAGTNGEQLLSCFPAGTLVHTQTRGAVAIERVVVGDTVVTHTGRVCAITQLHKNPRETRTVHAVQCYMTPEFKVTGNHKIWSVTSAAPNTPCWNEVRQLRAGDYMALPACAGTIHTYKLKNAPARVRQQPVQQPLIVITVDANFTEFLGMWYAEGYVCGDEPAQLVNGRELKTHYTGIAVQINIKRVTLIARAKELGFLCFGIHAKCTIDQQVVSVIFENEVLASTFHNTFGRGAMLPCFDKSIHDWHTSLIEPLLTGMLITSGYTSSTTDNLSIVIVDSEFSEQLHQVCRRASILNDITPISDRSTRVTFSSDHPLIAAIKLHMPLITYSDDHTAKPTLATRCIAGVTFTRIVDTTPVLNFRDQFVYTLGVADDHSYSVAGVMAQNCFLLGADDSLHSISKLLSDAATISKYSGGVGFWWNLRSAGATVKGVNGTSRGMIPFLKVAEAYSEAVDQGGKRPGSFAHYLVPHHPDFMRWIELRRPTTGDIKKLFYAVWCSDLFMRYAREQRTWYFFNPSANPELFGVYGPEFERNYALAVEREQYVGEGVGAHLVLVEIAKSQIATGMPYMVYADACNLKSNQKNIGAINSSNLCVVGSTRLLTRAGHVCISELAGVTTDIWNGSEWSSVTVTCTNQSTEVMDVEIDNVTVRCTPYHRFAVRDTKHHNPLVFDIQQAHQLHVNDKLVRMPALPVIDGTRPHKHPYSSGFFAGAGDYVEHERGCAITCTRLVPAGVKYCTEHAACPLDTRDQVHDQPCAANGVRMIARVVLPESKHALIMHLDMQCTPAPHGNNLHVYMLHDLPHKTQVPFNASLATKLLWLAGLIDSTGGYSQNMLVVCSNLNTFITDVRLLLTTLGVDAKIIAIGSRVVGVVASAFRLKIAHADCVRLLDMGMQLHHVNITPAVCVAAATHFPRVTALRAVVAHEPTYCFTEPLRNRGVFNGVLAMNCAEIALHSSSTEYATCTLATVCLGNLVNDVDNTFNFDELERVTAIVVRNLNRVIDINHYPVPETRTSNERHRPLGIGVQGLADVFAKLGYAFTSPEARVLNRQIFETLQYSALRESCELAKLDGAYSTFAGSPYSQGIMQHDMWKPLHDTEFTELRCDWSALRQDIITHGVRNSQLVALPPTASTSQIQNQNECFEPFMNNLCARRTKAGTFTMINSVLINRLIALELWTPVIRSAFVTMRGSIQVTDDPNTAVFREIPASVRASALTVWELQNKDLIDMDRDRMPFVCQTSSSNRFMRDPTVAKLCSMHMYTHSLGLKTGMYYLRSLTSSKNISFGAAISSSSGSEPDNAPSCSISGGCSG